MMFYEKFIFPSLDNQMEYIKETDYTLDKLCFEITNPVETTTEGFFGTLANFIKKIASMLANVIKLIWKKLSNFVRMIIDKIKQFFGLKKKNNNKFKHPIRLPLIVNINHWVSYKTYDSFDKFMDDYKQGLASINAEINRESLQFMKDLKQWEKINSSVRNDSPVQEKVIYNDQNMHTIEYPPDFNQEVKVPQYTKTGVLPDKSIINVFQNDNMVLSIDKLNKLSKAQENILKQYDAFKKESIQRIKNYLNSEFFRLSDDYYTSMGIPNVQTKLLLDYLNNDEFDKMVYNNAFPVFEGSKTEREEQIKLWAKLTVNKHKAIVEKLKAMLLMNTKVFNIAESQVEEMADEMNKGDFSSFSKLFTMDDPNNPGRMMIDRYIDYKRRIMDFSSLKLGRVIYSKEVEDLIYMMKDVEYCKRIFDYICRYDVVIFGHGFSTDIRLTRWAQFLKDQNYTEYKMFIDIYKPYFSFIAKKLNKTIDNLTPDDETNFFEKYSIISPILKEQDKPRRPGLDGLRFRKICPERLKLTKRWYMQKVYLPGTSSEFMDIEIICHYLLKKIPKCKRILIAACNPGGLVLDYKLRDSKNVLIISASRLLAN